MKGVPQFVFYAVLIGVLLSAGTMFAAKSNQIYGDILHRYVHDGRVDYSGLKKNEAQLDAYLQHLAVTDPDQMTTNDRFALYINGYNAYTIKLILNNFKNGHPPASIKDIGNFFSSPWSVKLANIAGTTYTLDNIEHDILRPSFQDPRVHFAINCASKSCPPLLAQPYSGETLDQQLEAATTAFINNRQANRLQGSTLYISAIFKWFAKDFNNDPISFFKYYAKGDLKKGLNVHNDGIKIQYLDYDWSLNGN